MVNKKAMWSWVLYDWANSAFATTVMAGFFPIFFKLYFSAGANVTESTAKLGLANSIASLLIAITAPLFGAVADAGGYLKRFLFLFTFLGAASTAYLAFIEKGDWKTAVIIYGVANLGFGAALAFYDAMLPNVSTKKTVDYISALGYAFGYLGGGVLFAFNVVMYLHPNRFGIEDGSMAIKISFISVALWWILFSLPCLIFVKEPSRPEKRFLKNIIAGVENLKITFLKIRNYKMLGLYLLAFFLYNDAVGTTIKMALDYGLSLGFKTADLITALLLVQFIGFPCAYLFGIATRKIHPKTGIYFAIALYLVVLFWGTQMKQVWEFYGMAALIGTVQGGIQALSRSYYSRLIPSEQPGQFFGFYNLLGKFTGLLGPALMGWVALSTNNSRLSLIPVGLLFVAGGLLLVFVREK